MDDARGHELRQVTNNTENEHLLYLFQPPPSYNDVNPIEFQRAPPSYSDVMQNDTAHHLHTSKVGSERGNDAQDAIERINSISFNLGQMSHNYPTGDNSLFRNGTTDSQNTASRSQALSDYHQPVTPNIVPNVYRRRNKAAKIRQGLLIFCSCIVIIIIVIVVRKVNTIDTGHEETTEPCVSNPCLNGGICEYKHSSKGFGYYICLCQASYYGVRCEIKYVQPCSSSPCRNGGICQSNICNGDRCVSSYRCNCPKEYYGTNCEYSTDPCLSSPCENGGSCYTTDTKSYWCLCPVCCTGTRCEIRKAIRGCASNPCQSRGQCMDIYGGVYYCHCSTGYVGKYCESAVPDA